MKTNATDAFKTRHNITAYDLSRKVRDNARSLSIILSNSKTGQLSGISANNAGFIHYLSYLIDHIQRSDNGLFSADHVYALCTQRISNATGWGVATITRWNKQLSDVGLLTTSRNCSTKYIYIERIICILEDAIKLTHELDMQSISQANSNKIKQLHNDTDVDGDTETPAPLSQYEIDNPTVTIDPIMFADDELDDELDDDAIDVDTIIDADDPTRQPFNNPRTSINSTDNSWCFTNKTTTAQALYLAETTTLSQRLINS